MATKEPPGRKPTPEASLLRLAISSGSALFENKLLMGSASRIAIRFGHVSLDRFAGRACSMRGPLVLLDVFLFESQRLGGVEDQHFHPDVCRDGLAGGLGDDDHQADGKRH